MASNRQAAGHFSTWCEGCGRQRGADGKCPNCDIWYNSGYVQVGLPLACITGLGMWMLIAAYGTHNAPSAHYSNSAAPTIPLANTMRTFYPRSPVAARPAPLPPAFTPVSSWSSVNPATLAPKPDPNAALIAAHLRLLQATRQTSAALADDDRRREQQGQGPAQPIAARALDEAQSADQMGQNPARIPVSNMDNGQGNGQPVPPSPYDL